MPSIRDTTSQSIKKQLRKIKLVHPIADIARNTLVGGCQDQGAYIQFGRDLQVYGLWEALLYAEQYEVQGMYAAGSVERTLAAIIKELEAKPAEVIPNWEFNNFIGE